MMDWLDLLNNLSSIALVIACWWLSHQYASMKTPYRKGMSVVYALLGITVLLSMMFRIAGLNPVAGSVIIKTLVTCILVYVARFIRRNYDIG